MKTTIIVPAYNESQSVGTVIQDLKAHGYKDIVVVDDGSVDDTGKIAHKFGVIVLRHRLNRGLGAALGTGFAYAKTIGVDSLVTFDADGQHEAKDIVELLKTINEGADVVIGSRLLKHEGMPVDRIIINKISNLITWILYGVKTSDSQSGLRAFSKNAINKIEIRTDRMEVSSEFFREIKKHNLRFTEVPIKAIYTDYSRESGQSNLNAFAVGFKMILRLFR